MNDFAFGFSFGDEHRHGEGGFDPAQLGQMLSSLGSMLSGMGQGMSEPGGASGPVNYDIAKRLAHQHLGRNTTPITAGTTAAVADAVHLAELWLDDATTLPAGVSETVAWTPAEWVDKTLPTWQKLCDPVAEKVSGMWSSELPDEAREMAAPMMGMLTQMGGVAFGSQLGQALGTLAQEVLTSTDIGLPLGPAGTAALLPAAISEFSKGLEQSDSEIMVYLAAREAAHQRLFGHVPWLRGQVIGAVQDYARGISMDFSGLEEAAQNLDPMSLSDPSQLEEILGKGTFEPQTTPQQQQALDRLETLLALIEGWVQVVVSAAIGDRLPGAEALAETLRRRRATGGPAEQTFATLVGLQLRPRKLREAAVMWQRLTEAAGIEKRDGVWAHPDLLPDAAALDAPAGFVDTVLGGPAGHFDDPLAQLAETEAKERGQQAGNAGEESAKPEDSGEGADE